MGNGRIEAAVKNMRVDIMGSTDQRSIDSVRRFVERNRVAVNNAESHCGDGRCRPDQSRGGIRVFGGDAGFIATIIGAAQDKGIEITPEQAVDSYLVVIRAIRGPEAKIITHTDDHHKNHGIGCGDIAKSIDPENESMYGIKSESVSRMFSHMRLLGPENTEEEEYVGSHDERDALLIEGENDEIPVFSVNSLDEATEESHFVVDLAGSRNFMKQLARELGIEGISYEDLNSVFERRMNATASLLAAGKEMFTVRFDRNGNSRIQSAGIIPQPR